MYIHTISSNNVIMDRNLFYNNLANSGGALSLGGSSKSVRMQRLKFDNSTAQLEGGCVSMDMDVKDFVLSDSSFVNQVGLTIGGALSFQVLFLSIYDVILTCR